MTVQQTQMLAPAELPASPRRRRFARRRPWQPTTAQRAAAGALALEIGTELTGQLRDFADVPSNGVTVRAWLTGAFTEADMAARYAACRQALANVRAAAQWSPDPAQFIEMSAGFARFLTER